jgi:hypothetical protein
MIAIESCESGTAPDKLGAEFASAMRFSGYRCDGDSVFALTPIQFALRIGLY